MTANPEPLISLLVIVSGPAPDIETFRAAMARWREELERLGKTYEVLVVDDGIGGAFANAALELRSHWQKIRFVQFRRHFGESVALDAAVEKARGKYLVTTTWYLQVDPRGLPMAVVRLEAGIEFVAGRRTPRVDGLGARLQSWLFNAYTRRLTNVSLHDLNCSFRAFRRDVADELHFHGDLYRFLSILAVQKGFRVEELSLPHLREEGRALLFHPGAWARRFLDILSLFFLMKFTHKPLRFFGLLGFAFFFVGLAISLWMLYVRIVKNQPLADKPLLVLGIFLIVLGFIVGSIGLIGEIIIFTQGRNLRDYHVDRVVEGPDEKESP